MALVALWLFRSGYVLQAFEGARIWPVAGFFFLPTTTLAFAYGMNSLVAPGEMTPLAWLLTGVALLFDLGTHGSGARSASRRQRKRDA